MTVQTERSATPRIASAGLVFLAITSVGWGLNWPIMKQILTEWPPLSARGLTGVAGGLLLAALAVMRGQSLVVPQGQVGRRAAGRSRLVGCDCYFWSHLFLAALAFGRRSMAAD